MENLSKQQIVLLAVLVSFVTSIATGIMTVSLLEEASPVVSQTVNRVVERTVERVVPQTVVKTEPGKTIVERETIVVKEDELVPESVEKNSAALVRVYGKGSEAGAVEKFITLGVIIDAAGTVLTPAFSWSADSSYRGELIDGTSYDIALATTTSTYVPYALVSLLPGEGGPQEFPATSIGQSSGIKLGQTVISMGGTDKNEVAIGIVSSLSTKEDKTLSAIETNLNAGALLLGSPLLNLNGQVVGMAGLDGYKKALFLPIEGIRALLTR